MKVDIGISQSARQQITDGLSRLLADTYTLYLKTHNFHWNVTGPQFSSLHLLFETHYTEMALAVDEIAERIRALGHWAPGSYQEFSKLSTIQESVGHVTAEEMVKQLVLAQEAVIKTARSIFPMVTEAEDQASADLLTRRMQIHEKNAWMLRTLLEDKS